MLSKKNFAAAALAGALATPVLAAASAPETVTLTFGEGYQSVPVWNEMGYNITSTSIHNIRVSPGNAYINEELGNVLHTGTPYDGVFHITNENGNLFNFESFTGVSYYWENPFYLKATGTKEDDSTITQTFNFVAGSIEDIRHYTMDGFTNLKALDLDTAFRTNEGDSIITNQAIDNLTFTTLPAVPEPQDWLLMTAGLAAVGGMARRRRKTETALSL